MKIYKSNNKIVIDSDKPFSDIELIGMLENKEIFNILYYGLGLYNNIHFIVNNKSIIMSKSEFLGIVKKSNIGIINKYKYNKIKSVKLNDKTLNDILSTKFKNITGKDVIDIFKSNNPIEMCNSKNIKFKDYYKIMSSYPFILYDEYKGIDKLFNNDIFKCNDINERKYFYRSFLNEDNNYLKVLDMFSFDDDVFLNNLKINNISIKEYANMLENFPGRYNISWERENFSDFNLIYKKMDDIWYKYGTGYSPKYLSNCEEYILKYDVSEDVKSLIDEVNKYNFNDLEKAYYLYKRVCQKFSYDDEFYVTNESKSSKCHGDFSKVCQYDFNNNLVSCYDIAFIYAKLCSLIGLKVNLRGKMDSSWIYTGDGKDSHPHTLIFLDNMVVSADSSMGKINNDMVYEKNGLPLKGFKCINTNPRILNEFDKSIRKVNSIMSTKKKDYEYYNLNEMLKDKSNISSLDFIEKEKVYLELIKDICNIKGTMMGKNRVLLDISNRFSNGTDKFISTFMSYNKSGESSLAVVISTFNNSIHNYYLITKDSGLVNISIDEVNNLINNNILSELNNKVPGLSR